MAALDRALESGGPGLPGQCSVRTSPSSTRLPAVRRTPARPRSSRPWPWTWKTRAWTPRRPARGKPIWRRIRSAAERAEILYRIGAAVHAGRTVRPGRGRAGAVPSRRHGDDRDLTAKIGPRIVECLNRLGRYGEVGRELSRRVEVGGKERTAEKGSKKVLATLTGADPDGGRPGPDDRAPRGPHAGHRKGAATRSSDRPSCSRCPPRPCEGNSSQEMLKTELFCRRARETGTGPRRGFPAGPRPDGRRICWPSGS